MQASSACASWLALALDRSGCLPADDQRDQRASTSRTDAVEALLSGGTVGVAKKLGDKIRRRLAACRGDPLQSPGILAFDCEQDPHPGVRLPAVSLDVARIDGRQVLVEIEMLGRVSQRLATHHSAPAPHRRQPAHSACPTTASTAQQEMTIGQAGQGSARGRGSEHHSRGSTSAGAPMSQRPTASAAEAGAATWASGQSPFKHADDACLVVGRSGEGDQLLFWVDGDLQDDVPELELAELGVIEAFGP